MDSYSMMEYVGQDDVWIIPSRGEIIKISEMDPGHCNSACQWLYDNATPIVLLVESALHESIMAGELEHKLPEILAMIDGSPRTWVRGTTLFQALHEGGDQE